MFKTAGLPVSGPKGTVVWVKTLKDTEEIES